MKSLEPYHHTWLTATGQSELQRGAKVKQVMRALHSFKTKEAV